MSLNSEADEQFEAHGGEDGEIDASELKQILDAVFTKGKHVVCAFVFNEVLVFTNIHGFV